MCVVAFLFVFLTSWRYLQLSDAISVGNKGVELDNVRRCCRKVGQSFSSILTCNPHWEWGDCKQKCFRYMAGQVFGLGWNHVRGSCPRGPWPAPWTFLGNQNGPKTNCQVGPLHLTVEMASQMAGRGVPWAAPWTFLGAQNGPKINCLVWWDPCT